MVPTFITGATEGYARLTANAYRRYLRYGILLRVYCLDAGSQAALDALGVPSIPLVHDPTGTAEQAIYGTDEFKSITMRKLLAMSEALRTNAVVVWVDGDVVPLRDPCDVFSHIAEQMVAHNVDLAMQCDEPTVAECSGPGRCWMCSGVMVLRQTPDVVAMVREPPLASSLPMSWDSDQDYINWFVKLSGMRHAVLPRALFPNGAFLGKIPEEAVLMHFNYLKGAEKEARMRDAGLWALT